MKPDVSVEAVIVTTENEFATNRPLAVMADELTDDDVMDPNVCIDIAVICPAVNVPKLSTLSAVNDPNVLMPVPVTAPATVKDVSKVFVAVTAPVLNDVDVICPEDNGPVVTQSTVSAAVDSIDDMVRKRALM